MSVPEVRCAIGYNVQATLCLSADGAHESGEVLMANGLIKRFWLLIIAGTCASLLLAVGFAAHFLSPRELGLGMIVLVCAISIVVARLVLTASKSRSIEGGSQRTSEDEFAVLRRHPALRWILRFVIALMLVSLVEGLWRARAAPLAPQVVGITMNLLFTGGLIWVLRRLQGMPK
jgi:hypothetical protein